jgi:hypothetical protein
VTGGAASKLSKIRIVRKNVARILTVINQTQKQELRKFYKVWGYPCYKSGIPSCRARSTSRWICAIARRARNDVR